MWQCSRGVERTSATNNLQRTNNWGVRAYVAVSPGVDGIICRTTTTANAAASVVKAARFGCRAHEGSWLQQLKKKLHLAGMCSDCVEGLWAQARICPAHTALAQPRQCLVLQTVNQLTTLLLTKPGGHEKNRRPTLLSPRQGDTKTK